LLDFQMPEMDGQSLARIIKGDQLVSLTRLVMLTSRGQSLSPTELHEFGIDSCILKPAKQSRLFNCITTAMVKAAANSNPSASPIIQSPAVSSGVLPPLEELRILLADDNIINQRVGQGQLRKLGYVTKVVANGLEAVEALEQVSYDVILMDCQMPEMDGYEATETIRKLEQTLDGRCRWKVPVHIIAMTAHAMEDEREKCLSVGMDDYLSKPIRIPLLKAALERRKRKSEPLPETNK
jgi:two-component system, sensor histidine kinase and response regulator